MPTKSTNEILGLIRRRRRQVLIHSFLYYRMNTSIVSDGQYDGWARELAELQTKYPEIAAEVEYAEYFADFGESVTGFDLPLHLPEVEQAARRVLYLHEK
ncbi:DNA ligase LigA-related protein [Paludifilum halophilum]|uniref:Uncharacterized protein n=1 Tax=Paludifilum halophilum TaxID=1642702 RepID=A0A235B999_9BACL|nr:hypothetical protein [Paludifilum halophilum]OYD08569.1 hypothetical protein CHM34_07010 [Paludifilum halophilum]